MMNFQIKRPHGRDQSVTQNLPPLTRNQRMIYEALISIGRSAKAYELIDMLRPQGVKAAPTVYRALHELEHKGLVKHIVSSRSFVALSEPHTKLEEKTVLVCDECGETQIIQHEKLLSELAANARKSGFAVRSYCIEMATCCHACCQANST